MRAGDMLRQLDRRLLPPLARGMARLGHGPVRLRVLTSVALLSSAAVLVTAVWAAERRPVGDPTIGAVTRVGVVEGQSIPGYLEASRGELAAMLARPVSGPAEQTYALVTMTAYLGPDRLAPFLGEVAVSEVFARVPLIEMQTQIVRIPAFRVPADVVAGMLQVADRKDREVQEFQERAAVVTGDGDRARDLREWYTSGAEVARAEATGYRERCSCVYAAVIRADAVTLDRIADRPEVRAVDPAPEVVRLDRAVFSPPLPDQHDLARPPVDAGQPPEPGTPPDPRMPPDPGTPPDSGVPPPGPGGELPVPSQEPVAPSGSPSFPVEPTAPVDPPVPSPDTDPPASEPPPSTQPSPGEVEESSPMDVP